MLSLAVDPNHVKALLNQGIVRVRGKQDLAGALQALDRLNAQNLNSYERAMTWNLYAFVHYTQQDYGKATAAYRKVLEQRPIPESLRNTTLFGLAQMLVATEQYQASLDALKEWFALVDAPTRVPVDMLPGRNGIEGIGGDRLRRVGRGGHQRRHQGRNRII